MMTQRAKLRRLAFIDFPSWSRGSRPSSLWTYLLVATRESPPRPYCNLGAARLDAKGTTPDYLAHLGPIPLQKIMLETAFSEVVKTPRADYRAYTGVICRPWVSAAVSVVAARSGD